MKNLLSWINGLLATPGTRPTPELSAIYIAGAAGEQMQSLDRVKAIEHTGLLGDRYSLGRGFWKVTEACQVTLISEDDLSKVRKGRSEELGIRLDRGHHRRNLVIGHLKTRELQGRRFRIGEAVFHYHKPRPPCGYLDKIEGKGLARALGKHSGICVTVETGGEIAVGDFLEILPD